VQLSYILYEIETGKIKRAHRSPNISNPNGYGVLMVDNIMPGIGETHKVDLETLELVPIPLREPTYEEAAEQVREERNLLLQQTDWSQLPDVPQKLQKPLRMYRRALRHIPQQKGFPFDVSWPQYPL